MRGKLLFITGGMVGYVLGARAGRKRYEQIAAAATELWNAKPVQRRVTEARDFALDAVGDVPSQLFEAGKKAYSSLHDKAMHDKAMHDKSARKAGGTSTTSTSAARSAAAATVAKAEAKPDVTADVKTGAKPGGKPRQAKTAPTTLASDSTESTEN